jgi:hypothetical protein
VISSQFPNTMKYLSKLFVYTFCFLCPFLVCAQSETFQDGFVITTANDTLFGKLFNAHQKSHVFIKFQSLNKTDTIFTPNHLLSYEIDNQRFVVVPIPHPTKHDTAYLFAQVLVDGYASLYKTKLKTDPFTSPENAFLCKKHDSKTFFPAGNTKNLAHFFSDNPSIFNELKTNGHQYDNSVKTKTKIFNQYNEWRKSMADTVPAKQSNIKVEKTMLELYLAYDNSLSHESKYELYKIASKMSDDPSLKLSLEYVENKDKIVLEHKIKKETKFLLYEFYDRIEETSLKIPENQQIQATNPKGVIVFYYFR